MICSIFTASYWFFFIVLNLQLPLDLDWYFLFLLFWFSPCVVWYVALREMFPLFYCAKWRYLPDSSTYFLHTLTFGTTSLVEAFTIVISVGKYFKGLWSEGMWWPSSQIDLALVRSTGKVAVEQWNFKQTWLRCSLGTGEVLQPRAPMMTKEQDLSCKCFRLDVNRKLIMALILAATWRLLHVVHTQSMGKWRISLTVVFFLS